MTKALADAGSLGAHITVRAGLDGDDIIVSGRLDFHSAPDLRDACLELLNNGCGPLRLHLEDADIADATALGLLVHLHRLARVAGREFELVNVNRRTARLLAATRLTRILRHVVAPRDKNAVHAVIA